MAKTCIQCGKKIGLFHKAVDGIYCSLDCQAAAQAQIAEAEQVAAVQRAEAQKQAEADAEAAQARQAAEQAAATLLATCPKCGASWSLVTGPPHRGRCSACGFEAEFSAIASCPSCEGKTLLVEAEGASRCPRCKYRGQQAAAAP